MTGARLLLAFEDADHLIAAAHDLRRQGLTGMDAHVPFHIEELDQALDLPPSPVRRVMLIAAILGGGAMFALQWWTSVLYLPINSGGRPFNSWPVFMFAVFEIGVLSAAFAGIVTLFYKCGLPRLNDPFFADARTEAASNDGFYLSLPEGAATPDRLQLGAMPGVREIIRVAP